MKEDTVPVVPVRYCRHPVGGSRLEPHSIMVTKMFQVLSLVPVRLKASLTWLEENSPASR